MISLNKKHYLFLCIIVFFICAKSASASLIISQIMSDPEGSDTNREWVKLYNDGEDPINIIGGKTDSAWRVGDGATGDVVHYLSDSVTLSGGEYMVIAKDKDTFLSENNFTGEVITSSISLPNTSGVVKIFDGNSPRKVVASKSYTGNDTSGTKDNTETSTSENTDNTNTGNSSGNYIHGTKVSNKDPKVVVTNAEIIADKVAVVGLALSINSEIKNNRGITFNTGRFVWSFGDGGGVVHDSAQKFDHVYRYPGEYVLTLKYYKKDNTELLASDRLIVKVVASGLIVKSIGDISDPYIELENKSDYEIDLSGWIIKGISKDFTIPEGTILLSKKTLKISGETNGFSVYDISSISIINKNLKEMARFPNKNYVNNYSNKLKNNKEGSVEEENLDSVVNLNEQNQEASAGGIKNINYPLLGLIGIIVFGVFSVIFMKKWGKDSSEDEVSSSDFKIME